jgi:molybdopterin-containing oxidoreductase family iron-sulfur binding subunit
MKRLPITYSRDLAGKSYWRSLGELEGSPEFQESLAREFPDSATAAPSGVDRRQFLTLMGASLALGGLAGCRRPEEQILPYGKAPEEVIPGKPLFFATATSFAGTAFGLLVESHEGRPTKIEGNPRHPDSLGATSTFLQAMILDLYDPDRSDQPEQRGAKKTWEEASAMLKKLGDEKKAKRGAGLAILTEDHRSPTVTALLDEVKKAMPEARFVRYEPLGRDNARKGHKLAFGHPYDAVLDVERAMTIVAVDADILVTEGSSVRQARGFVAGRTHERLEGKHPKMNRLYAIESVYSLTGTSADHRLRLPRSQTPAFVAVLAAELIKGGLALGPEIAAAVSGAKLADKPQKYAAAIAKDLLAHKGTGLLVIGRSQPAAVHALAALINHALENTGKTVRYVAPFDEPAPPAPPAPPPAPGFETAPETTAPPGAAPVGAAPAAPAGAASAAPAAGAAVTAAPVAPPVGGAVAPVPSAAPAAAIATAVAAVGSALPDAPPAPPPAPPAPSRPASPEVASGPAAVVELAQAIRDRKVDTLLILGGNPAFSAPADAKLAEALANITAVHLSSHVDETSSAASWHLNRAHQLESWGDVRAEDGTASIVQPLIAPLYLGRTDAEVLDLFLGRGRKAYELVRATWAAQTVGIDPERAFRRALHEGVWADTVAPDEAVKAAPADVAKALPAALKADAGFEVTFHVDPHTYDGRFANNGWLHELPEPMTKLTWGNAAHLSPATAKELGVEDGDLLSITAGGAQITIPALITPGQTDKSVALTLGHGRTKVGHVGKGVGVNVGPLRTSAAFDVAPAQVAKASGKAVLSRTQEHFAMEGRPLVREATLEEFKKEPAFAEKRAEKPNLFSLWKEHSYEGKQAWGMNIDLNACVGCNACVTACQAENNIPIVGPEAVQRSREMHWLRIDRYFEGTDPNEPVASHAQPMMCAHCEMAPCEQVCPVGATTHSPEGLNDMAYNRCIGTRYCANNCPFKVRKFNFFDYNKNLVEIDKMRMNPDVTVRMRGVMEKCTFCVQRINHAKIDAHREGQDKVADGLVLTACQQACPTQAIVFGDLNDKSSKVAEHAKDERSYRLLEEINIKPRVSYQAKVKNPNPALEGA